jgi:hypothetical protein
LCFFSFFQIFSFSFFHFLLVLNQPIDISFLVILRNEVYLVHGILFKFALDNEGLYGNSDENAQKAAGHDLKRLIAYWICNVPGLHFPLMALIHYMGYCLVAVSIFFCSHSHSHSIFLPFEFHFNCLSELLLFF